MYGSLKPHGKDGLVSNVSLGKAVYGVTKKAYRVVYGVDVRTNREA